MRLILASHGPMAKAMLASVAMILGIQECCDAIELTPEKALDDVLLEMRTIIQEHEAEEFLILVDMLGGTPSNAAAMLLSERVEAMSGLNLPLLMEALMKQGEGLKTTVAYLETVKANTIVNLKKKMENELRGAEDDQY